MIYRRPQSLPDCLAELAAHGGEDIAVLAGGTDLMPRCEKGGLLPDVLIDLKGIREMTVISEGDTTVTIGALTTVETLRYHPRVKKLFPALAMAANQFAGLQIRHRGTLGGNICNASPAGDLLPALRVHGAEVTLASSRGERRMPLHEFITGPGETVLTAGELLVNINLPVTGLNSVFHKVGLRQTMAIAVVNLALAWQRGTHQVEAIAAGAVGPVVVSLDGLVAAVHRNGAYQPEQLALVDADIAPITDIRASAGYRRRVLNNLLHLSLTDLVEGRHD